MFNINNYSKYWIKKWMIINKSINKSNILLIYGYNYSRYIY